ncbi:Crp/Fnr family transcriptional regulator [Streptomyces carminius]|uniref:Crp/Fnr family transcriptional regulator n=1 Tax=Streptomyces carminius TaxID=2665496 RepID=A0A2M8LZN3_9ACTN|nr:Crp/Fnr family transcriptional regulator [Streptomyces carminius]PJE97423.1 Crp/Fnr family transcriptional regulator [Streptomyces carminius]
MTDQLPRIDSLNLADVLHRRQPMPDNSFLGHLPDPLWPLFVTGQGSGVRLYPVRYTRLTELPLGPEDGTVFVVLKGCVAQKRHPYGPRDTQIVRFRGAGQLLGEVKLLDPRSSVETVCLDETWVLAYDIERMHRLLTRNRGAGRQALLLSLEERNRTDEAVYCTVTRPPLTRVSALLHHLAATVGTRHPDGTVQIAGPRQTDLADALLVSRSTVENAVSVLRAGHVVVSSYRRFLVTDPAELARLAGVPENSRQPV